MKLPGPDHPIVIAPTKGCVVVRFAGRTVVDTTHALTLNEASYPGVQYVTRADTRMDLLQPSPRKTQCPYKGEASYFSVTSGDKTAEDAVWSYEKPYPAMQEIAGRLAFYPDKVEIIIVAPAD